MIYNETEFFRENKPTIWGYQYIINYKISLNYTKMKYYQVLFFVTLRVKLEKHFYYF